MNEEETWIDFELRSPPAGAKIKVLREMQFVGKWDGEQIIKGSPDEEMVFNLKEFWQFY